MLKTILSISGRPGLFKLVSQGKNMLIVESLTTKKRMPAYARDKVVSLGDIAIYTDGEEVPLSKVMTTIYEKNGKALDPNSYKTNDEIRDFFLDVLPNFDQDRVYLTDIKKIISWYNLLLEAGITSFEEEETEENSEEKSAEDPKKD